MSNLPKLTEEQYEAAVELIGENTVLTSGAGCGKTLVLARRFNELIMQYGKDHANPFEHLVALTFTDKAADEMTRRVRLLLLEMLKMTKPNDIRTRRQFAEWITSLPAANISTIHSFCATLLKRYAIEAGIDPDFTVCADDLLKTQLITEAAEQAILRSIEAEQDDTLELLTAVDMRWTVRIIRKLLEKRYFWNEADYSSAEKILARWEELRKRTRSSKIKSLKKDKDLRRKLLELQNAPCVNISDLLWQCCNDNLIIINRILNQPNNINADDFDLLRMPGNTGKSTAWGGKEQVRYYRSILSEITKQFKELKIYFQSIVDNDIDVKSARFLSSLIKLTRRANEIYKEQKRIRGLVDFDDLITLTSELLQCNSDIRLSLQEKIKQLLIDECQDVDPCQLNMLSKLIAQRGSKDENTIILIGDPKQSIYHFRGVVVEKFLETCKQFKLKQVPLSTTFRMHRAGVSFINHLFSKLMDNYENITSARKEVPEKSSVEILLADTPDNANAEDIAELQAELLASRIVEIIDTEEKIVFDNEMQQWRAARFSDFAILFSRMTKSLHYEYALQQKGIPYYVVGGVGFFQQQEIYDMLNALRVIDNPFDDIALFGLLRSEVFGLNDNVLLHIASLFKPPYFPHLKSKSLAERMSQSEYDQLCFAHRLLQWLHNVKDAIGPAGLIEEILTHTGYPAVLFIQPGGKRRLGNIRQLIAAARSWHQTSNATLADFVRQYNELILDQSRYEQADVVGAEDNVVRIMTIHKAKGLEFPIVIIPDINTGVDSQYDNILTRCDWGITLSLQKQFDQDQNIPISHKLARIAEKEDLQEEDIRKMYVAFTRHKDYLILIGADWRSKNGNVREKNSYLDKLDNVFNIINAISLNQKEIKYDRRYSIHVEKCNITPSRKPRFVKSAGLKILSSNPTAEKFHNMLLQKGQTAKIPFQSRLLSPLISPTATTISATALCNFAICPMLYRWKHILRPPLPVQDNRQEKERPSIFQESFESIVAGTFFHRCMELADFTILKNDKPGEILRYSKKLTNRVLSEMELNIPPELIIHELEAIFLKLKESPLINLILSAQRYEREIAFIYKAGSSINITGQIDLLFQDAKGHWHIVDYKSDKITSSQAIEHARGYELQMMLYLIAARKHFGQKISEAIIYFLKAGELYNFTLKDENSASINQQLEDLTNSLLHSIATGRFDRISDPTRCKFCPYANLCLAKVKNA